MPIRILLPSDASAFQSLRLHGLLECPTAFASSYQEEVDMPISVVVERLDPKPDRVVLGSFSDRILEGVIGVRREGMHKLAHKAFIWGMYVLPECRLRGLGKALVAGALQYARDQLAVRQVNLGVNTRNVAAIALYQSMGFRTYGTEPGFLRVDGVLYDEHLMSCVIA